MLSFFSKKQPDIPRRRSMAERDDEKEFEDRYSFRRNRTLTGSSSSQIVSTGEFNAQLKSPRVQVHELAHHRRHIGAALLMALAGSVVSLFLITQFTASVAVRAVDVTQQLDSSYAKIIEDYLSSQPLERLRFMMNGKRLDEYVASQAPEIASVQSEGASGFGETSFVVHLRQPLVGWTINGQQRFVDNTGTAFTRNYFSSPDIQVVDKSGVQIQTGHAIASNRFLSFVGRAVDFTKKQGFIVTQVIIPQGSTRQVELGLKEVPYPIKLSIDRGVGEQTEDMARALRWLKAHNVTPKYLDVRVRSEAFYRL